MRSIYGCTAYRIIKILLLILVLIISGCATSPHTQLQIDKIVAEQIDREITCPEAPAGTCEITSELLELADRAYGSSTPEHHRHYASMLEYGQDALLARLHLIRAARITIDLQTYIWHNDEVGRMVFHELLKAARRGVMVRIIVDAITISEDPAVLARLATAHANLRIAFYNPEFLRGKTTPLTVTAGALFSFRKINQRMHNKVFIVDHRIAIVGGRNIENKYYDYDPEYSFKDRDILVIGPAVQSLDDSFNQYWNHDITVTATDLTDVGQAVVNQEKHDQATILDIPDLALFSDIDLLADHYSVFEGRLTSMPVPVGKVLFMEDPPGKSKENGPSPPESAFAPVRKLVAEAERSITVQSPYFFLSSMAYKLLHNLRKENPDIRITVSSNSLAATDLYTAYAMTFKQKRHLLKKLKIDLFEFMPYPGDAATFLQRYDQLLEAADSQHRPRLGLHGKSFVIDSSIAVIGSHNLNPRSQNINTEVVAVIWDEEIARAVEQNILVDTKPHNSWVIARTEQVPVISHFSNILGAISSMLPFFDIWPFQYSSSFQLHDGMEPLAPGHPDFYSHYSDVGQFPETGVSSKALKTRLLKAFGGILAPIL